MDMAQGIASVLEIVEADRLRRENEEPVILGCVDSGNLMRFAIAAARSLQDDADDWVDWLNTHGSRVLCGNAER
jgi:hypothetical protein